MKKFFLFGAMMLLTVSLWAKKLTTQEYIDAYKYIAVKEMMRTGIPASITLAQGIHESGSGNSRLATEANNHFGIKCHTGWDSTKSVTKDDDVKNECFRKYSIGEESFVDHSEFLRTRKRYAFLFEIEKENYVKWAYGLQNAGYATNPNYAKILIDIIKLNGLDKYDKTSSTELAQMEKSANKDAYLTALNKINQSNTTNTTATTALADASTSNGKINIENGAKYVTLANGETINDLAIRHGISTKNIYKYNDASMAYAFKPGDRIYLQSKKSKAMIAMHKVAPGETLWDIAQRYGIKLNNLQKMNKLQPGNEVAAGQELNLKASRTEPLQLASRAEIEKAKFDKIADNIKKIEADKWKQELEKVKDERNALSKNLAQAEEQLKAARDTAIRADISDLQDAMNPVFKDKNVPKDKITTKIIDIKPATSGKSSYHTVVKGDTAYNISKRYNLTVEELMALNKMTDAAIQLGQKIRVK